MQHSFVGRKRELRMLGELFKKKSASLVVIRGNCGVWNHKWDNPTSCWNCNKPR